MTKDFCQKVQRTHGYRLTRNVSETGEVWFLGLVVTPLGYVFVHAEPSFISLSTMHDGYEINRWSNCNKRTWTQRGIAIIARRFIEEIQ